MAKKDFDIDFDFEKEFGFDPNGMLDSDIDDEDLDLSSLDFDMDQDDQEDSFDLEDEEEAESEDFDYDDLEEESEEFEFDGLEEEETPELDLNMDAGFTLRTQNQDDYLEEEEEYGDEEEAEEEDEERDELDFEDEDDDFDEDFTAGIDFSKRAKFFGAPVTAPMPPREEPAPVMQEEDPYEEEEPSYPEEEEEEDIPEGMDDEGQPKKKPPFQFPNRKDKVAKAGSGKEKKAKEPVKITMPPFLLKLYKLYFPSMDEINPKTEVDANGRRRRKKSKTQIFKEAYLPAILAGITLVLIVSFAFGSLSNFIKNKQDEKQQAILESQAAEQAAQQLASESKVLLERAAELAAGYDYDGAIETLDSYAGEPSEEMTKKKAEYVNAKQLLVEHKDPSTIPNLSFHVLIADPARAFGDSELGGQYNRNFVTTDEFSKILDQLYMNNYVLVDFDSFTESSINLENKETFVSDPILLPEGKKPVMITETMVNYFDYMVDSDKNGEPDAGGDGFAYRLVVDDRGDIKAQMVDGNGQTQTGNYDLVPILEDFIKAHPDFSYRGSRATLAVCGMQGVFGYRINSSYVPTMTQAYVDQEIADAKVLVQALKDKGYNIACYTYDNVAYQGMSAAQIQADMASWTSQIKPVVGDLNTFVFARTSDIGDYSGTKFQILYDAGFRVFVKDADEAYCEVNTSYIRQSRIMVTGNAMAWKANRFTTTNLFDPNMVLDLTARGGDVPN